MRKGRSAIHTSSVQTSLRWRVSIQNDCENTCVNVDGSQAGSTSK